MSSATRKSHGFSQFAPRREACLTSSLMLLCMRNTCYDIETKSGNSFTIVAKMKALLNDGKFS